MQSSQVSMYGASRLQEKSASAPGHWPKDVAVTTHRTAVWGLASVYLLLAYEWLISGFNKLMSADFQSGLGKQIQDATASNPNHWYARFLTQVALPHTVVMAFLVQWGEIAVGLGLVLGAVRWLARYRFGANLVRWLDAALIAALMGGAFMTLNYWLMSGNTLPWLNAGDPFNEGIDIDGLLTLVSIALVCTQIRAMRTSSADTAR